MRFFVLAVFQKLYLKDDKTKLDETWVQNVLRKMHIFTLYFQNKMKPKACLKWKFSKNNHFSHIESQTAIDDLQNKQPSY